ncbi:MAG: polysaccharide deacetylase family protein [Beijerinckiaceae bacterium]
MVFAEAIAEARTRRSFAAAARLGRRASHRIARHVPLAPVILRNDAPLVTFTFDDVPVSAHATGAAIIEAHSARATFYIATGLLGQRSDYWTVIGGAEVADLHRRGHEIALHSHLHRPAWALDAARFADDIKRNRDILSGFHAGIHAQNFAYPFGQCTLARKHQLHGLVRSSRSIYAGVNRGVLDRHYIRATELCDARLETDRLDTYLDQTQRTRGWLVFLLHDISDAPSPLGCSRRLLDRALEGVARRGMRIATIDTALDLVGGADICRPAQFTHLSKEFGHG